MTRGGGRRICGGRRNLLASQPKTPANTLYGFNGITGTNFYQTASPGGEPGSASGFGFFALWRPDTVSPAGALISRFGVGGYAIDLSAGSVRAYMVDGSAGTVIAPTYTVLAGDVGKVQLALAVHDGTKVRLYNQRVEVGAGSAITGYTAATTTQQSELGERGNPGVGNALSNGTLFGGGAFTGAPSLAQIQAFFDAVKTGAGIPTTIGGGTMTHVWRGAAFVPASLADKVGSDAMSRVGSPTAVTLTNPTWSW